MRDLGTHVWGRPFYTMKLVQHATLHEVLGGLRQARDASEVLSITGNFTAQRQDQIGLGAHSNDWIIEAVRVKRLETEP